MELNADFSERAVVHSASMDWLASPTAGVDRRMLDRIGGEVARATSIVRYAPNSHFPAHVHTGGEEFLVLEGVFQDEHGDFPAGSYVRNPPTSSHTPGSEPGCTIFVKLWQFDPSDRHQMTVDTNAGSFEAEAGETGVSVLPLYKDDHEDVRMELWDAGAAVNRSVEGGLELLVLDGSLIEGGDTLVAQSWLRLPIGTQFSATAGSDGCRIWIKSGHLANPPAAPSAG